MLYRNLLKNAAFLALFGAWFFAIKLQGASSLSLMSFNIRRDGPEKHSINLWHQRKEAVIEIILKQNPDILCLQEATIEQIVYCANHLDSYTWTGQGRGKRYFGAAKNEYVPIFFSQKKFILLNAETIVLNKGTSNPLRWHKKGKLRRIATWVKLQEKETGKICFVYNVHLDYDYPSIREKSIKKVMKHLGAHTTGNEAIFIAGDFNTNYTGTIKKICAQHNFSNAKEKAELMNGPYNTAIDWNRKEKYCIDHLLYKTNKMPLIIKEYTTINTLQNKVLPSDHYPIMLKATW